MQLLSTRYGRIDRLWFDYWGMPCGEYGSNCPTGSLPAGYTDIYELVQTLSPDTVMLPGSDGCLSDTATENGRAMYPLWNYRASNPTSPTKWLPVVCRPVTPDTGAVYYAAEVDFTIQQPGDHWFWDHTHPYLNASQLFNMWLETYGKGSSLILNIPPSTAGSIPSNFVAVAAGLGHALNASFGPTAVKAVAPPFAGAVACGVATSVLQVPAGVTVDAVRYKEDITAGQHIRSYTLEVANSTADHDGAVEWKVIDAAAGGTLGPHLIDLIPRTTGPAQLRWKCTSALPAEAPTRLLEFAAFTLAPPAGWHPPVLSTTTWALQTLYTPVGKDMTPCATRSRPTVSTAIATADAAAYAGGGQRHYTAGHPRVLVGENRSSCSAYINKPGYEYAYVRDEHCCFLPPGTPPAASGLVPLYLLYSQANNDHLLASRQNYTAGGQRYSGSDMPAGAECWGYRSNATGTLAPLDLYWSAARKDTWSLSSGASRSEAIAQGYSFVETTAYVPSECA